jgi:hypothetical protein
MEDFAQDLSTGEQQIMIATQAATQGAILGTTITKAACHSRKRSRISSLKPQPRQVRLPRPPRSPFSHSVNGCTSSGALLARHRKATPIMGGCYHCLCAGPYAAQSRQTRQVRKEATVTG